MAEIFRVLGQAAPAAGSTAETNLLTVPANNAYIVSTLTVCNRGANPATFRVAVAPDGVVTAAQHYVYYDATIGPNVTVAVTIGMTLDAGDVVRVSASTADLSFSAFGTEVTP